LFKLAISNTVTFQVKGSVPDSAGKDQPFSFTLTADRVKQSDIEAILAELGKGGGQVSDWLADRVTGWSGVQNEDGADMAYSREAFEQLLDLVGMSGVIFGAYVEACGARGKAKN
jgi:hypothetical protein